MNIYPKHTGPIGQDAIRTSPLADSAPSDATRAVTPVPSSTDRSDKVSISDAGRALAARDSGPVSAGLVPRTARTHDLLKRRARSG